MVIHGLGAKDFHVFEDGVEQKIDSVRYELEPLSSIRDNLGFLSLIHISTRVHPGDLGTHSVTGDEGNGEELNDVSTVLGEEQERQALWSVARQRNSKVCLSIRTPKEWQKWARNMVAS